MTQLENSSRHTAVPLAARLAVFGDRAALVDSSGYVGYTELAERVSQVVESLGPTRRLVSIAASNDVESIVAYLGCLAGGHVALLTDATSPTAIDVRTRYRPDTAFDGKRFHELGAVTDDLHPELALLLSTSGSTGSPKLVRLSHDNVQRNAESIAEYLEITDRDTAALTLPMHYCYGLSVINSNLLRGASVMLTDRSVVDECFWQDFARVRATSFHGVPFTFDLLDKSGFVERELPSLRYVTQAGGRLDPDKVVRYARLGEKNGWRLFVMYGQTEATSRMAYLPPESATTAPRSIGRAVPGGELCIDDGELVYSGPNVMLGYAESRDDLGLGRTTGELRTGDLARVDENGMFEIIGRKNRFLKIAGLRIDLAQLEQHLQYESIDAVCTGDDTGLVVAVRNGSGDVVETLTGITAVPAAAIEVSRVDEYPQLANGKIDYPKIIAVARGSDRPGDLRCEFSRIFRREVDLDESFVSLGGDSLSYIAVSTAIEKQLGHLPDNWHEATVAELISRPVKRSRTAVMETGVAVRAVATVCVVANHVGFVSIMGGAHVLLMLAGWNFARFTLGSDDSSRKMVKSAALIAVPSCAWITYRSFVEYDVGLTNILLVNNYFGDNSWGYWYIDALVQVLLVLSVLFVVPAVRRLERRHGFAFAIAVLVFCVGLRRVEWVPEGVWEPFMVTHVVVWLFALGWAALRARSKPHKALVVASALLLIPGFFDSGPRDAVVLAGVLLVILVPRVRVPKVLVPVLATIGSASLYIYLTQYGTWPWFETHVGEFLTTVLSVASGVAVWWLARRSADMVVARRRRVARDAQIPLSSL